jgi:hypothetical protein
MFSKKLFLEQCSGPLATTGRLLVDPILRHADILIRWGVAAFSLGIFGMISLITGIGGILVFGFVPIIVFEYARGR